MTPPDDRRRPDCRRFTGNRPCPEAPSCSECSAYDPPDPDVLIIHLDALGDVLRNTVLIPAVRRAWPRARITWLARKRALALLEGQPGLDQALALDPETVWTLEARRFDVLLAVDRSPLTAALAMRVPADERRGFGLHPGGAVVALRPEAVRLWETGLDDLLKFHENTRTMQQMVVEAMGLPWVRAPYVLPPGLEERRSPARSVGFNVGSSPATPARRLPEDLQVDAARRLARALDEPVLLLGGPEDADTVARVADRLGPLAEATPVDRGLREGAAQVARCEVVVTGDSLGMHLAVAAGCHVVAWFGPTVPAEIDLFDRGIKLLTTEACAPCMRGTCDRHPACRDRVDPGALVAAVLDCLAARRAGRPLDDVRPSDPVVPR
ncbi:MAG: glycosyltransferase family 9 protein [Deltaproteobacteria bacterium]|nr:glycosyltransferase family 9 protein [Deltaproteobacteria bacterium]